MLGISDELVLTGHETLEELDKKILQNIVGDMALINLFNQAVNHGIKYACGSTELTQSVCNAIGQTVENAALNIVDVAEQILHKSVIETLREGFSKVLKTPQLWQEKYGIPAETTSLALESSLFAIPLIGTFKLTKIAKVGNAYKGSLRFLQNDAGALTLFPKSATTWSSDKLVRLAEKVGYTKVPGGGKGGHIKLRKPDSDMLIIPGGKQSLPIGTAKNILKTLEQSVKKAPLVAIPLLTGRAEANSVSFERLFDIHTDQLPALQKTTNYTTGIKITEDYIPLPPPPVIEEVAQKIVDVAGDLTGINPIVSEAKELKSMFTAVLLDPENAPKLLINKMISNPEQLFNRIITAPSDFIAHSETFLVDPTLTGALGAVSAVFTVVSIANEILPMMTRLSREMVSHPEKIPLHLSKELVNLTFSKIKGLVSLAKGLVKNPLKTGLSLIKGVAHSPKQLVKNVKSFLGIRSKRKKRRAKRKARLQAAIQLKMTQEQERIKTMIIRTIPHCYDVGVSQWLIDSSVDINRYFLTLIDDWKKSNLQRKFNGEFLAFINTTIQNLESGHFSRVVELSPTAHLSLPTAPPLIAYATLKLELAFASVAFASIALESQITSKEKDSRQLTLAVNAHAESNRALANIDKEKLRQFVNRRKS